MDRNLEEALRGLKEATEFAQSYSFELDDWYLDAIKRLEDDPANQAGTDKSWVCHSLTSFRRYYTTVRKRRLRG